MNPSRRQLLQGVLVAGVAPMWPDHEQPPMQTLFGEGEHAGIGNTDGYFVFTGFPSDRRSGKLRELLEQLRSGEPFVVPRGCAVRFVEGSFTPEQMAERENATLRDDLENW